MRDIDAADSLGDSGSPKADRDLCENFGLTVKRVREFDPQALDVTLACKFLGLPLKRFDRLAGQPDARDRWVESVASQKKVLIELFPEASRELKETLESIRKFATRKCLNPGKWLRSRTIALPRIRMPRLKRWVQPRRRRGRTSVSALANGRLSPRPTVSLR